MKYDLTIDPPVMNAAGCLGFAPDLHGPVDLDRLGAFVTNPVSLAPRRAAAGARHLPFPGGLLLHTGYPNPGLRTVLRRYAARWRRAAQPVLVHLLAEDERQVAAMVARLEEVGAVTGVELGAPPWVDADLARALVEAAVGELPVILRLPLDRAVEIARHMPESGVAAISLAPPRGALPGPDRNLISGRLYGPAVFPRVLAVLQAALPLGVPVIAAGGIYQPDQIDIMLKAGAHAVQLDTWLWRGGLRANTPA